MKLIQYRPFMLWSGHGNSHPRTSHSCSVNPICRTLPVILNYNCYVCICTWIYIGHESLLGLTTDFLMPRYLGSNLNYTKPALDKNVRSSGHSHDLSKLLSHLLSRLIYLCCAGCICTHYMCVLHICRRGRSYAIADGGGCHVDKPTASAVAMRS